MIQIKTKPITLEEFLQLPETKPAQEYISGEITKKVMPQGKHSKLQWDLLTTINANVIPKRLAHAFPELRCTFGERSLVPDVVVLRWERIPLDERGKVANIVLTYPDWVIEILSPGQNQTKVTGNILHCLEYGSNLGWLIDPEERCVLVFPPRQQPLMFYNEQALLPTPDFLGDLKISAGQIFGWLKLSTT